jgi:hypothetical protein
MEPSDTYMMIFEEGQIQGTREDILIVGEERLGLADECFRRHVTAIADLARLQRMLRRAVQATSWQEIVYTP